MRRVSIITAFSALMTVLVMAPGGVAVADTQSGDGCEQLNDPALDGFYTGMRIDGSFKAGDTLHFVAGEPDTVTAGAEVQLELTGPTEFLGTPFPGEITYEIPEDAFRDVRWQVRHFSGVPAQATWSVSCTPAVPPLPAFCESGSAFGDHYSVLARDHQISQGNNPGTHSGYSICIAAQT